MEFIKIKERNTGQSLQTLHYKLTNHDILKSHPRAADSTGLERTQKFTITKPPVPQTTLSKVWDTRISKSSEERKIPSHDHSIRKKKKERWLKGEARHSTIKG